MSAGIAPADMNEQWGRQMKKFVLSVLALAMASQTQAANLVVNGNFEAGDSGFTSDYTFNAASGGAEAVYTVGTDPKTWNSYFTTIGDHTSGTGQMMIVNGSQDVSKVVWRSDIIAVDAATNYFFEAFVASVYPASPPILTFMISLDGGEAQELATLSNTLNLGEWEGLSTTFNTGSATSVQLFLRNAQSAFSGNDFAVDDIHLSTTSIVNPTPAVPEPASWAMMIGGLGLAGGFMRRRAHPARVAAAA